jgi:GNAT superfamily N-acetyltransferase
MSIPPWHEESIAKHHDRNAFDCGDAALNEFLRRYARQTHEQGGAKTFVAVPDDEPTRVLGFYTLSPVSVAYARTPEIIKRGLARHDVPAFRLGRLAVDRTVQHQGLGGQLLLAAGRRCLCAAQEVGGVALLIDAKHDAVATWYESYGALRPLATVKAALEAADGRSPTTPSRGDDRSSAGGSAGGG